jgi:hypothetical protein
MKKKDIIAEIQKLEASYWLQVKTTEVNFGENHEFTSRQRSSWAALDSLMQVIGVKSDPTLPDNLAAKILVLKKYNYISE